MSFFYLIFLFDLQRYSVDPLLYFIYVTPIGIMEVIHYWRHKAYRCLLKYEFYIPSKIYTPEGIMKFYGLTIRGALLAQHIDTQPEIRARVIEAGISTRIS